MTYSTKVGVGLIFFIIGFILLVFPLLSKMMYAQDSSKIIWIKNSMDIILLFLGIIFTLIGLLIIIIENKKWDTLKVKRLKIIKDLNLLKQPNGLYNNPDIVDTYISIVQDKSK